MASTFTILKYDETKSSARYKSVMNDGQLVVAHLQTVDTLLDAPLSQLSLCPGVPEAEVVFSSVSITKFLIEKMESEVVYRLAELGFNTLIYLIFVTGVGIVFFSLTQRIPGIFVSSVGISSTTSKLRSTSNLRRLTRIILDTNWKISIVATSKKKV